jgi:hypothetical protein
MYPGSKGPISIAIAIAIALVLSTPEFAQSNARSSNDAKIDINTATERELDQLPGVGPATAKKIIAGRPYSSVSELSRAGVSKRQIERITSLVTVSSPGPGSANRAEPPGRAPSPGPQETTAPKAGMVWVNTDTKVYHREGDRFYGKTKHGKYMTESEAIQAGYRAAKK